MMDEESGRGYATRILPIYNHREEDAVEIHTLASMDGSSRDTQKKNPKEVEADQIWSQNSKPVPQ